MHALKVRFAWFCKSRLLASAQQYFKIVLARTGDVPRGVLTPESGGDAPRKLKIGGLKCIKNRGGLKCD